MKRSEMIEAIKGDLARMDLDFMHGRNLEAVPYHTRVEMVTSYVLFFAEKYGMLPPIAFLSKLGISDNAWENEDEKK